MWVCLTEGGVRGKRCTFFVPIALPERQQWAKMAFCFSLAELIMKPGTGLMKVLEKGERGGEEKKKKKMDRGKKEKRRAER